MKKLLVLLAFSTVIAATSAHAESDYYARVCDENRGRARELDKWCESYQKHSKRDQSTKNDKGHIDELMGDKGDRAERGRYYEDWNGQERGAYGNYQAPPPPPPEYR